MDYPSLKIKLDTIFSDKTYLTHKKNYYGYGSLAAALAARIRRRGPGGPDPAAQPRLAQENDAALAPTVSASAIRLHNKFGASLVHFLNKI
jgi:hypothetical protein